MVCYAIEGSQLCHAPWIDTIRHTRLGALVLGYGFLWSDIICYTVGAALCGGLERVADMRSRLSDARAV